MCIIIEIPKQRIDQKTLTCHCHAPRSAHADKVRGAIKDAVLHWEMFLRNLDVSQFRHKLP